MTDHVAIEHLLRRLIPCSTKRERAPIVRRYLRRATRDAIYQTELGNLEIRARFLTLDLAKRRALTDDELRELADNTANRRYLRQAISRRPRVRASATRAPKETE